MGSVISHHAQSSSQLPYCISAGGISLWSHKKVIFPIINTPSNHRFSILTKNKDNTCQFSLLIPMNFFFRQITKNQLEKSKLYIICFQNKSFKMIKTNLSKRWKMYQMFVQYLQIHIQFPSEEKERCSVLGHDFQFFRVSKVH